VWLRWALAIVVTARMTGVTVSPLRSMAKLAALMLHQAFAYRDVWLPQGHAMRSLGLRLLHLLLVLTLAPLPLYANTIRLM